MLVMHDSVGYNIKRGEKHYAERADTESTSLCDLPFGL